MNTIIAFFQNQVKAEAEITRKFLKIIPEDKYDWKPHPKSMSLVALATHIAELPSWIPLAIDTDVLDFAVGDYKPTQVKNNHELQTVFEENQKKALEALARTTDEFLQNEWTMCNGKDIYMTGEQRRSDSHDDVTNHSSPGPTGCFPEVTGCADSRKLWAECR